MILTRDRAVEEPVQRMLPRPGLAIVHDWADLSGGLRRAPSVRLALLAEALPDPCTMVSAEPSRSQPCES